jgi:TPR repeat protein
MARGFASLLLDSLTWYLRAAEQGVVDAQFGWAYVLQMGKESFKI